MDFTYEILTWYDQNKRNLPWRNTTSPYFIWLSEIILQQTKVDQGLPYYEKFISNFPTVQDLAKASEDEVLKNWQGLGYYSRARNLHKTAKIITEKYNGNFPSTYNEIIQLKGIGPYTAAAIASFAFKQKTAVVDGNVYRVLSRFFNISTPIDSTKGKKQFEELANILIDEKHPDLFNHAIMDFGAMQCTPKSPNCIQCPLSDNCEGYNKNLITQLPFKEKKTKIRNRYFNYLIVEKDHLFLFEKREEKGIWKNMYQFPLIESGISLDSSPFDQPPFNLPKKDAHLAFETTHILSHQKLHVKFWKISNPKLLKSIPKYKYYFPDEIALPRLIEKYLDQH